MYASSLRTMILLSSSGYLLNLIAIEAAPSMFPQLPASTGSAGTRGGIYPFRRIAEPGPLLVGFLP